MPIVTGASSVEKLLITWPVLLSKTWKLGASRPVTRRFVSSVVTVMGTSTRLTSTWMRAFERGAAAVVVSSAGFGGGAGMRVSTLPSGFSLRAELAGGHGEPQQSQQQRRQPPVHFGASPAVYLLVHPLPKPLARHPSPDRTSGRSARPQRTPERHCGTTGAPQVPLMELRSRARGRNRHLTEKLRIDRDAHL